MLVVGRIAGVDELPAEGGFELGEGGPIEREFGFDSAHATQSLTTPGRALDQASRTLLEV
jgi:hypothetical protein